MASTRSRFMGIKSLLITVDTDAMPVNDALASGITSDSQEIGSNSENDSHANHFLQAVELSDEVTLRTYDLTAAIWLKSKIGKIAQVSFTIPHASEGSSTTDLYIATSTTCDSGAMIQSVNIDIPEEKEGEAEITLIFRCKSSGQASGLTITEVAGS